MLESDDHFSDSRKDMISFSVGEDNAKPLLYFIGRKIHKERKYKLINIVLDGGPLRSDGTQQATEEELRSFKSHQHTALTGFIIWLD